MRHSNTVAFSVFPALCIENAGFDPKMPPANRYLKEVVARVAALAAPLLYLYQLVSIPVYTLAVALANQLGLKTKKEEASTLQVLKSSALSALSSLLEIPHKLITGPHSSPNYLQVTGRNYQLVTKTA